MTTFASEPGVRTDFIPGEQFPGLPGGLRFPALIGESQTYILRENIAIVKGGLLTFSYNSLTGLLSTETAHGTDDVLNIIGLRRNGLDFELVTLGNSTPNIDLADISLLNADISAVRVGGTAFVPTPTPVTHTVDITNTGYSTPILTITAGDTVTWDNLDTLAHAIKNDNTSAEEFDSSPTNLGPGDSFSHTFETSGTFNYFDPLLPQDTNYVGTVVVEPVQGYVYDEARREITFTQDAPVLKNGIEVDTIFATSTLPVTIRIDGQGITGPYDLDISPPRIQQILKVQLMDIADQLPDTDVLEIMRVGNTVNKEDYTSLDYLLVNDQVEWGAAASKAAGVVAGTSVEGFVDKVFIEVGDKLDVLDNTWILTVLVVGMVGVGTYRINNGTTGALVGTFTTSAGVVPGSPIPGVNLTVTETTGTTVGDTVVITTNAGSAKEPEAGDTYFVTYKVRRSDFQPRLMFRFADVKKAYGNIVEAFNPDGTVAQLNNLSLAAYLTMINGSSGVVLTQTDFGTSGASTATDYIDALDKLKDREDIGTVIPLTSDNIVREFAKTHVIECSGREFRRERMAFVSAPAGSSLEELIAMARGLSHKRVVLVTPTMATTEVQDMNGNPVVISVEGFFIAAALAGLNHSSRFDVAEPLTRKRIVGFRTLEGEFLKPEKDRLSENGVLTIQTIGASHSVRQSITTSTASVEEREISITKITDFTALAVRSACERFIGSKLVDETPIWVESSISNILQALVNDKIIQAFGGVSAFVDPNRPDTIQCSFQFKPIYPVNFINITFSINGRL